MVPAITLTLLKPVLRLSLQNAHMQHIAGNLTLDFRTQAKPRRNEFILFLSSVKIFLNIYLSLVRTSRIPFQRILHSHSQNLCEGSLGKQLLARVLGRDIALVYFDLNGVSCKRHWIYPASSAFDPAGGRYRDIIDKNENISPTH